VTQGSAAAAAYSYDANSNRISRATPSSNDNGTYDDQDRLLSYGGTTFTYTANGEIASRTSTAGTTTYGYDSLGRLVSVSLPDGRIIEYVLDARGRRVAKKVNGAVVGKFLYENGLRPIAQLAADDSVVAQFVYAERGNSPSLIIRGGVTYRVIADHHGSPRYIIDSTTGAFADTLGYDEFGVTFESNPGFQPFGFAGGLYDADTQLVHFGAREYDPSIGRFLTKDPLGLGGGLNVYDYAANDPVNLADPSGLLFGHNAGEEYAQQAVEDAADTITDPNSTLTQRLGARISLVVWSLWTPCNSDKTAITLAVGAAAFGGAAIVGGAAEEIVAEEGIQVTEDGLSDIASHLGREGFDPAPENDLMLQRLQNVLDTGERATGADANFYEHELYEKGLMDAGDSYEAAHQAALEDLGASSHSLYPPEVVQAVDEAAGAKTFGTAYYQFWNLP
jgi:RHS repeat-associated protein